MNRFTTFQKVKLRSLETMVDIRGKGDDMKKITPRFVSFNLGLLRVYNIQTKKGKKKQWKKFRF